MPYDDLVGEDDQTVMVSNAFGRNYARSVLDDIFSDNNLIPGARLELADGLWRPADIAECFPEAWDGVCDFFCCTSEYLAEETKYRRPEALFRADSRCLYPTKAFAALSELIPSLRQTLDVAGGCSSLYMDLAYKYDFKYGEHPDDHHP